MPDSEGAVPGIHTDRVTRWFRENVPEAESPLGFQPITGGRSNLTYDVHDAQDQRWVLRRPPLHGVLPSAHDVGREYRIMAALLDSSVPVPRVRGMCWDEEVSGAPFFVMDYVAGRVVRDHEESRALEPAARRRASEGLADVLAALHAVEPAAVGLGDLGRTQDYVARQLRRWQTQAKDSFTEPSPLVREVHDRLQRNIPEQAQSGIVHGDYRLDNVIVGEDGNVRAVLDWELCTLGDPLADLGLLLVYWTEDGDEIIPTLSSPTDLPGYLDRDALWQRYARSADVADADLDFYVAFALWRLAVILQGVYVRHASGAYGDTDATYRTLGGAVPRLLERSHERSEAFAGSRA